MTVTPERIAFPYLDEFSAETRISQDNLIRVFQIESEFHKRILASDSPSDRSAMYADLYATVHPLLQPDSGVNAEGVDVDRARGARNTVLLFRQELAGKSVLDVGCGDGHFLLAIHDLLPHGDLFGLDISEVWLNARKPFPPAIKFLRQSIVSFTLDRVFDVVFSNQVFEHLAPSDVSDHLRSVHNALVPGGRFILSLPNRLWGPSDITRIVDNTYRGRVAAQGSHLNESSYSELIPLLQNSGFRTITTVLPFASALPSLRSMRVRPWLNELMEKHPALLAAMRTVRRHGRPVFRNLIVLICSR
jgi:SAM-dependent methyltransferase